MSARYQGFVFGFIFSFAYSVILGITTVSFIFGGTSSSNRLSTTDLIEVAFGAISLGAIAAIVIWSIIGLGPSAIMAIIAGTFIDKFLRRFHDQLSPTKAALTGAIMAALLVLVPTGIFWFTPHEPSMFWSQTLETDYLFAIGIPGLIYILTMGWIARTRYTRMV